MSSDRSPLLVLATGNAHKVQEMKAILADVAPCLPLDRIVPMTDFNVPSPVEDGRTFEENAALKARAVAKATGLPALADDSGLQVDIMGGAPGIFSARWAGTHGEDRANLDLLLAQLADVPQGQRGAQFACAASLAVPDGKTFTELGVMRGSLLKELRGEGGFGYDPAFVPDGHDRTTAEMTPQEKNQLSHRGKALEALAPVLCQQLGQD